MAVLQSVFALYHIYDTLIAGMKSKEAKGIGFFLTKVKIQYSA